MFEAILEVAIGLVLETFVSGGFDEANLGWWHEQEQQRRRDEYKQYIATEKPDGLKQACQPCGHH